MIRLGLASRRDRNSKLEIVEGFPALFATNSQKIGVTVGSGVDGGGEGDFDGWGVMGATVGGRVGAGVGGSVGPGVGGWVGPGVGSGVGA